MQKLVSERTVLLMMMAISVAFMGCGESGPPTAPISGTVMMDGAPAVNVDVMFVDVEGTITAMGQTDGQGKYELNGGAALGENTVYFSKFTDLPFEINPEQGMDAGQLMAMSGANTPDIPAPKQLIPQEYSDPTKTTVKFIVPPNGADNADFQISTK